MDEQLFTIEANAAQGAAGLKHKEKEIHDQKFHKLAEHEIEGFNKIIEADRKLLKEDREKVDPAYDKAKEKAKG